MKRVVTALGILVVLAVIEQEAKADIATNPLEHSMTEDTSYENDDSHPIPSVNVLDVVAVNKGGGATVVIVIATPLSADKRSQERLLQKIENYLGYINSKTFSDEAGNPTTENTRLEVAIHKASDKEIFELLERCRNWIESNNALLIISEPPRPQVN
jgi:glycerol-3-phosphate O-acyltransferase